MKYSTELLFVVLAIFCHLSFSSSKKFSPEVEKWAANPNTDFLGQIGKKLYFLNATEASWYGAGSICTLNSMKQAEFDNSAEFNFVYERTRGISAWVGGALRDIDNNLYDAFVWKSGNSITQDVNFISTGPNYQCMYSSGDHHTYVDVCSASRQVLCQVELN